MKYQFFLKNFKISVFLRFLNVLEVFTRLRHVFKNDFLWILSGLNWILRISEIFNQATDCDIFGEIVGGGVVKLTFFIWSTLVGTDQRNWSTLVGIDQLIDQRLINTRRFWSTTDQRQKTADQRWSTLVGSTDQLINRHWSTDQHSSFLINSTDQLINSHWSTDQQSSFLINSTDQLINLIDQTDQFNWSNWSTLVGFLIKLINTRRWTLIWQLRDGWQPGFFSC